MLSLSRITFCAGIALSLTCGLFAADQATMNAPAATTQEIDMKKVSEAFGNFIGRNLNTSGVQFDLENVIKGIREGAAGKPSPLNDQEYEAMMLKVQEKAFSKLSEENLTKANDYLKKNKSADGVKEIEASKLQYQTIKDGTGATVTETSTPLIQYKGTYLDGTVFGNSEEVGGPIKIPLNQTIPGFSKGILGMKEGEKRRLFVHPDLGYGTAGHLPPNSLLIFEVEVIKADSKDDDHSGNDNDDDQDHDDNAK